MIPFFSRRNQVYPVLWRGRCAVEKHFFSLEDWRREDALYALLGDLLPLPELLERRPGCLTLAFCSAPTLLAVMEEQERSGFSPVPWRALAAWLRRCAALCGQLPLDGNLRNFLWDGQQVLGLDLESFRAVSPAECGAAVAAALLTYKPADTVVKQAAAALLAAELEISDHAIAAAREALAARRSERRPRAFSGVVLAGGMSSRMGRSKPELLLRGKTLLQWQVEKLRRLGIADILISGSRCFWLPGTRTVPDILPQRGPLGGLHACLDQAENSRCVVLGVDTPLVPVNALAQLCRNYKDSVTVLRRDEKEEPLIGVYASSLAAKIHPLIQNGGAPVRSLQTIGGWDFFDYLGPAEYLQNCNTPENFQAVEGLLETYAEKGVPPCF